jgi:glycosyltransferase involved in cell wall biosynthesis
MDKVSIITPSFNREKLVVETAQSIFSQDYPNFEWIIVDDGSTDNSRRVLQGFAENDSRVKIFKRSRTPKGACVCRNQGVEYSTGKYLIFLDTDDLLEPFCLKQRVESMEQHPELDFAIFPSLMFQNTPFDLNLWWNIDKEASELQRQLHQDAICQGTGVIWRKDSFVKIGLWDEQLLLWQDIDLFLRAYLQKYNYKKFFHLPPDLHNRMHETSLSRGDFFVYEKQLSRIVVVKRAVELIKANHLEDYLKETIYMLVEIASGLFRSKHHTEANNLLGWAFDEKIISLAEYRQLKKLVWLHKLKLTKFSSIHRYMQKSLLKYHTPNTLAKIPYKTI